MKFGLRAKINAGILSLVLVVISLLVGFMSVNLRKQARTANFKLYDNIGKEVASQVTSQFNLDLGLTRALASSYEGFADMAASDLEQLYSRYLKQEMIDNENYLAFWISLELKELDPDYPANYGRITWLYDRLGGDLSFRNEKKDTDPNNLSPQYQDIKRSGKESLIDPYWYIPGYQGAYNDSLLETTIAVPVKKNNQVVGLAGIDFRLDDFYDLTTMEIDGLEINTMLLSNNGTIVSHEKPVLNGTALSDLKLFGEDYSQLELAIRSGDHHNIIKAIEGEDYYYSFNPISVGNSSSSWSICTYVPLKVILADANKVFWRSVLLGFIGLILLGALIYFISSKIIQPVETTTRQLTKLSQGQLDQFDVSVVKSRDEIGAMTRAMNSLNNRMEAVVSFAKAIGEGRLDSTYPFSNKEDVLGKALSRMQENLIKLDQDNENQNWVKTGLNGLNEQIRGDRDLDELVKEMIRYVAKYMGAQAGALYIVDEERQSLRLVSGYAFTKRKQLNSRIDFGEGLVGQCYLEKDTIQLMSVPDDYFPIQSATGSTAPKNITVQPCIYNNRVLAVLELASLKDFGNIEVDFLNAATQSIAIGLNSAFAKDEMKKLLAKTLEQKEELQAQEEELREANQELEKQTDSLRQSEASLQAQQEELRVTNQELEKNAQMLEEQSERIQEKNSELEITRQEIERKAEELALASKYKSEFLANMSHELRTPLNSMLILSQSLAENIDNNLNPEEIESAEIIYKSGKDLLNLINEVLDLSKIEAGKMSLNIEQVNVLSIAENMQRLFGAAIEDKQLQFVTNIEKDLPIEIYSDQLRIEQVLKNLFSNAIKFTSQGSITLNIKRPPDELTIQNKELDAQDCIMFEVADTGIGISKEKQNLIFEAFQQEDGSTSRKYGGTGLGLSISRELIHLLGGEIQIESEHHKGSLFRIILPAEQGNNQTTEIPQNIKEEPAAKPTSSKPGEDNQNDTKPVVEIVNRSFIEDDRGALGENDLILLIIEDDAEFSKILVKQGRKKGFKCLTAETGETGLSILNEYPVSAVILDIKLPGIDGWQVLDQIKKNTKTRHIPVHMMSGEEADIQAFQKGAMGYLTKPVSKNQLSQAFDQIEHFIDEKVRKLLLVEDDALMSQTIQKVISGKDIGIAIAATGEACLEQLQSDQFDCVILDLGLPDMDGFELIRKIEKLQLDKSPPIIVYTGQDLTKEQQDELKQHAKSIIVKGVKSEERLLDETTLFMHRVMGDLSDQQQHIIKKLYNSDDQFKDKTILLVDDDMRNIFALTKVFQEKGMEVLKAANGLKAVEQVKQTNSIDLILMDIMMPEMDGYEATREIRTFDEYKEVPIIALTAKAMKEDKQKCLDAGASDYITKPVDVPKLLSLIRVWLSSE